MARHSRLVGDALGRVDQVAELDAELVRSDDEAAALRREVEQTRHALARARLAQTAAELRGDAVWSAAPIGMALVNEVGEFAAVNEAMCRLLGRSESEILGRTTMPFTHPDDTRPPRQAIHFRLEDEVTESRGELRYLRPDGEVRWARVTATDIAGPRGQAWTLMCADDVTDRRLERQALQYSAANLAGLARVTRRIQAGDDARTTILAALLSMAGAETGCLFEPFDEDAWVVTSSAGAALPGSRLTQWRGGPIARALRDMAPVFVAEPGGSDGSEPSGMADGSGSMLWQPVLRADKAVAVLMAKWPFRIDEPPPWTLETVRLLAEEASVALAQEAMRAELVQLARTDPLTGLPNRREWDAQLAVLGDAAAATGEPLIIAMVDLDHFKRFNDRHGHTAGDAHLREFAVRAQTALRDSDLLTRWGGEEFAVALPNCRTDLADAILRRVQQAVPGDQTCSIGWSDWDGREPLEQLMLRVDRSLYEAKAAGRDRIMSTSHE